MTKKVTINRVNRLHAAGHVIIHVTMKHPVSHTVRNHLNGCEDSWEEVVHVFSVVSNTFLYKIVQNRKTSMEIAKRNFNPIPWRTFQGI